MMTLVGIEPRTSRFGVQRSTTTPPRLFSIFIEQFSDWNCPLSYGGQFLLISQITHNINKCLFSFSEKKRYNKIKCCLFSALEGNSEAQPVTILQRSVSLSAGELTPSVGSKGSSGLSPRGGRKPSIEELRKQVCCEILLLIMYCLLHGR